MTLSQSQTLLAKSFGQPSFHALQSLLKQPSISRSAFFEAQKSRFDPRYVQAWAYVHDLAAGLERETRYMWMYADGNILYLPHGANLDDKKAFVRRVEKSNEFHRIVAGLLSIYSLPEIKAEFKRAQAFEGPHLRFEAGRQIVAGVGRNVSAQLYFGKGLNIEHMKVLTLYSQQNADGSWSGKTYDQVRAWLHR